MIRWLWRSRRDDLGVPADPHAELARLGREYAAQRRRNEQLEEDNEGLAIRWRSANKGRLEAQLAQVKAEREKAEAERAAADAVARLGRIQAILSDPGLPPADANSQALRMVTEGQGDA